ncbi:MAG: hypothetical protein H0X73_07635 [Chthoniobacterales bacterium]|nr:hypothetical protein [Chthoniobacterales bacterium]
MGRPPQGKSDHQHDNYDGVNVRAGRAIVVWRVGVTGPISYALGKTVQYLDRDGRTIEASMVRPGVRVQVYYNMSEGTQVVNRVVVNQCAFAISKAASSARSLWLFAARGLTTWVQ